MEKVKCNFKGCENPAEDICTDCESGFCYDHVFGCGVCERPVCFGCEQVKGGICVCSVHAK